MAAKWLSPIKAGPLEKRVIPLAEQLGSKHVLECDVTQSGQR